MTTKELRYKNKIICCNTCIHICKSYSTTKSECLDPRTGDLQTRIVNGIRWESIWKNSYKNWKTKKEKTNHLPDRLFEI